MLYIFKKNLRDSKKLRQELQSVNGFGSFVANQMSDRIGINPHMIVRKLRFSQKKRLLEIAIKHYVYGSKLKRLISKDIKRLISICAYRGFRHKDRLPARGQRTHSNARTAKRVIYFTRLFASKASFPHTRAPKKVGGKKSK
jgi:small subunit ribosomal protein S13